MFDKKNKSAKKSADRAPITVQALSVSDQQRQQIEQNLANFDPTWDGSECHLSMPLDATTQAQLGQLVSMFPNGEVRLETANGNIIMSGAGGSQYGSQYGSKPSTPGQHSDDTEPLPTQSRAS